MPFDTESFTPDTHRAAGLAIALATIVSTVFVALDESGGGQGQLAILQSIARLQGLKALVHGVAIASLCAYVFGFSALARRLSIRRPAVQAGLVSYLLGCVALVSATVVDGFVIPSIAVDAIVGSPERVRVAYELVHYAGLALTDAAKIGWLLQAAGALVWAIVLVRENGLLARIVGGIGVVANLLVLAAVLGSGANMGMASILAVLLAQLLWNLAAAWLLVRAPREALGARHQAALVGA